MKTAMKRNEMSSPLHPLQEMEVLMGEFGEALRKADSCLRRANENYSKMMVCHEIVEGNVQEMNQTMEQVWELNERLQAENEKLRSSREDVLVRHEECVRKEIYGMMREALGERDELTVRMGNMVEWVKMLDTMRTMFRKMPDLAAVIDELLEKHRLEAPAQTGMTVNNPQNCSFVESQCVKR